jgi:hypothetical protein
MPFYRRLTSEDYDLIKTLALQGEKLEDIAKQLSTPVSRQRVKQITQQLGIDSFKIRQAKKAEELHEKMFSKWGQHWDNKKFRKSAIYQAMREKFRAKKANALRIGKEFTIEFGELTFPTHCPILGIELDYFSDSRTENSVTFDRVDPTKGYISGNVVIISWRANRIKNDGTAEEHQKIAKFMLDFASEASVN